MEAWRKNLYILWGTQFLAMMGMNLVVPFLPFFIRQLGVTDPSELARWSGLVFSGPFILSFFVTPIWGNLGDRYGQKIMVVRAIFGLALSQFLMGFSQNVYQLFFFRIVQGAISGFISSTLALVSTNTPKQKIGYALGVLQSSTAGGMLLGPFVGGILADVLGYRPIFFVTAALCFAGGLVVAFRVQEASRKGEETRTFRVKDNFTLMLTDRRLRVVGFTIVASQISVLMIEPIFALFVEGLRADTKYLSTLTGGIFSVTGFFMVISAPWWGKHNDRTGYKNNLYKALAVFGVVYAGHIIVTDLFQLAFLRAFLGFAWGGVLPALYSLTNLYSPSGRRGGMIAVASSLTVLGNMLGPAIGGAIAGHFGFTVSFVSTSCLLLGTSYLIWRYLQEDPPRAAPVRSAA